MRRLLMVGAGGFASAWIRDFLRPFLNQRVEIAGLVDRSREALDRSGDLLGLEAARRFQDMGDAFREVDADCCAIVIPPAAHRQAVMLAAERGMHILSEKPIADTLDAVRDIRAAAAASGVKFAVTQNYRFTSRMLTFRRVLRDGALGRLNYLVARFAADYRTYGSWGAFRHEIPDTLLIEGAVHHFDMIRNLAGADCDTIAGVTWNPPWSSFKGDSSGLFVMRMAGGVQAVYEGNCSAAGSINPWHREYYRAECERGAVVLEADDAVRVIRDGREVETAAPAPADPSGHQALIRAFLDWLDGGPEPETSLRDNVNSAAMIFAAIAASRTGHTQRVAGFL